MLELSFKWSSCWLSFSKLALTRHPLGLWQGSSFTIGQDSLPSSRPKVWFSVLTPHREKTTLKNSKLITSSNAQTIMAVVQPLVQKYRNKMSTTLCIQTLSLLWTKDKTSVLLLEFYSVSLAIHKEVCLYLKFIGLLD